MGTKKIKHLGRGLQSLLGPISNSGQVVEFEKAIDGKSANFPPDNELRSSMKEISIDSVMPNPYQPRTKWDDEKLTDLANSIKANGVVQPIIVRPMGSNYELIAGERRLRAAKLAQLETIPALVRKASDEQLLELALVENIHRTDLNPIERALAYRKYLDMFGLTQVQAAERLGEDRSVIANYIRLLDLPSEIKQMLINNELSMGHARAILSLPTDELRRKLANRAMAGRLSVREVERLVRLYLQGGKTGDKPRFIGVNKPPHIIELETNLSKHLGTRVVIRTKRKGQQGRIIIEFGSIDEFDRITEQIGLEIMEKI
ncbi:MAG: ParB/RepB/Spo0J family partition protein [Sedimentisphaerales bacterium]|nr:ParB/RepB/Spo0J family partition protein [Sedimentisphaerales bacterium]